MDELINESTGEVVDAGEHLAAARAFARDLERLDRAIKDNKTEGKDLKDEREATVRRLRAHVRDVSLLPVINPGHRRKARKR